MQEIGFVLGSKIYDSIEKRSSMYSAMTAYMTRLNAATFAGKSYDDTLREENSLWLFPNGNETNETKEEADKPTVQETTQNLQKKRNNIHPQTKLLRSGVLGIRIRCIKNLNRDVSIICRGFQTTMIST